MSKQRITENLYRLNYQTTRLPGEPAPYSGDEELYAGDEGPYVGGSPGASSTPSTSTTTPPADTTTPPAGTTTPPADTTTSALGGPGGAPQVGQAYDDLAAQRLAAPESEFAGYVQTQDQPEATKGETFMTPETTVQGQLQKILQQGSPLMDLAAKRSAAQASALGMMSSSGMIGAGQKALYDTAMEIAKPDAATAAQFKQQEQALVNEQTKIETEARVAGDLNIQKAKIAEQTQKVNDSWAITLQGLDQQTQSDMLEYKAKWDEHFKMVDGALARELSQLEIDANAEALIMNQAHDMINNYQISVQQLMSNETFLDAMGGDAEKMHGVFNDMLAGVTASIEFSAKSAGVYTTDFAGYLDDLIADSEW